VVGAGVFGAWTAHHLQRSGAQVTLIDAHGPAHSRSSSGGESRLTRAAYGKDAIYARMALASLTQWHALSRLSGLPVLHPTGVLFLFNGDLGYLNDSMAVHRRIGLPSEALTPADMGRRFPMFDFKGVDAGIFEPRFGALMARRAVQTLVTRFVEAGGRYRQAVAAALGSSGNGPLRQLALANAKPITADAFVLAGGPWMPQLVPDLLRRRIVATRQEIFYFAPPAGNASYGVGEMPGWADFNSGHVFYGFPDLEGRGVKIALDDHGVEVDPDRQDRRPTQAALDQVVAFRDRRFPGLRGAPLAGSEVCQYENSSNGDLLIDRHPRHANVVLVGGGSGHGFKHGPEVGRIAAGLALGARQSEPRFSLATKAETQKREVI
jgi:glycine/D-amino acid oxidase-like deaminating enzyme